MVILKTDNWAEVPTDFTGVVENSNGSRYYYRDGKLHREKDKPAIEYSEGSIAYYRNGKRHRDGGPAIKNPGKHEMWYQDDKLHRDDGGPAITELDGKKLWFQNNKPHRIDGPAIVYPDGTVEYWINGEKTYKEAVEVYRAWFPEESQILSVEEDYNKFGDP